MWSLRDDEFSVEKVHWGRAPHSKMSVNMIHEIL